MKPLDQGQIKFKQPVQAYVTTKLTMKTLVRIWLG